MLLLIILFAFVSKSSATIAGFQGSGDLPGGRFLKQKNKQTEQADKEVDSKCEKAEIL